MGFPIDIFTQAFEGNWVAWAAIALSATVVGLICLVIFVWWKMPGYAKAGVMNETIGSHNPTMATCYENKRVKFNTPHIYGSGIAYDKTWNIFPKLWAKAGEDLTAAETQLLNAVYTIEGSSSAFYLNYALQAAVCNPELAMVIEHEREIQKLREDAPVYVKKEIFQKALEHMPDEYVAIHPINMTFPLDIRKLRTFLQKSIPKSILDEIKFKIKEMLLHGQLGGVNLAMISLLVGIVTLIAVIVTKFI